MLLAGLGLIICGIGLGAWLSCSLEMRYGFRPAILGHPLSLAFVIAAWFAFLFGGLFLVHNVYPVVALLLIALYIYLVWRQRRFNSDRARVERILNVYDKVRLYRPQATSDEVLIETLGTYLRDEGFNEDQIAHAISVVLEPKASVSLHDFVSGIISFQAPSFRDNRSFNSMFREIQRRSDIINTSLARMENVQKVEPKRPELSKGLVQRLARTGFNVEELSAEQLLALDSAENPERYHWLAREAGWIAYGLAFIGLIQLIRMNLFVAMVDGTISIGILYVVWRTQTARSMRMFREASIRKYAEERRKTSRT